MPHRHLRLSPPAVGRFRRATWRVGVAWFPKSAARGQSPAAWRPAVRPPPSWRGPCCRAGRSSFAVGCHPPDSPDCTNPSASPVVVAPPARCAGRFSADRLGSLASAAPARDVAVGVAATAQRRSRSAPVCRSLSPVARLGRGKACLAGRGCRA